MQGAGGREQGVWGMGGGVKSQKLKVKRQKSKFTCLREVVGKTAGLPACVRLWVRRQGKRARGMELGAGSRGQGRKVKGQKAKGKGKRA